MNVNFSIYRKKGTDMATIYCQCAYRKVRFKLSTGIELPAKMWDQEKQRVKPVRGAASYAKVSKYMNDLSEMIYSIYAEMSSGEDFSDEKFKKAVVDIIRKNNSDDALICPYYLKWATTPTSKRKPTRQGLLSYRKFAEYAGKGTTFSDVNYTFINQFIEYLTSKGYSLNYVGINLKNLKAVMNAAYNEGLHSNLDFKNFEKMEEDADSIYLNEDDIRAIREVEFLTPAEKSARDLFLIGYYTAMRFSDYSRLKMSDISEGKIYKFRTKKTGAVVSIPAHPLLVEILEKYNGSAPKLSEAKFNEAIKSVCQKSGIDDIVKISRTVGGERKDMFFQKYELVTSHTARRSGATNMYKSGIPKHYIMMITGHTSEKTFNRYIRISDVENADNLASARFFNE